MLLAMLLAAATSYVEMSGGPAFLHQSGHKGTHSAPMLRLNLGTSITDRLDAGLWLSGAMDRSVPSDPGDRALVVVGAGGQLLLNRFGEDRKWSVWLHGGAGLGFSAAGQSASGPMGYAGALLSFQPLLKQYVLGLAADGVAWKNAIGLAVLPSLRCTF